MQDRAPVAEPRLRIAIAGNPNAGKSSLFNRLTGLRQKVGNYPGVTVERKVGRCQVEGVAAEIIDLPGAYSLTVQSPDEQISRDVLFGWLREHEPPPDVVLIVVDATNLHRNLFMATQIIELGYPTVIALNMCDVAEANGLIIDPAVLERGLGVPVIPTVASRGEGLAEVGRALLAARPSTRKVPLAEPLERQVATLGALFAERWQVEPSLAPAVALRLITTPDGKELAGLRWGSAAAEAVAAARVALEGAGIAWQGCEAGSRYPWLSTLVGEATTARPAPGTATPTDKIDRVLTHRFWGPVFFVVVMALVFQSIYAWAAPLMEGIQSATTSVGTMVRGVMPPGVLTDLLVDGVIAGVGAVVVFLPQILLLFLFLAILEDSGYMARAAFVMDRVMSKVGLHGRSFVPLLSSFACAIPGILATRTIASKRDRLATILVAPLITCSARLPVYALLIAAFVPKRPVLGRLGNTQGLALLGLYLAGIVMALLVATVLKRTVLRGPTPPLLIELPPYKTPNGRQVAHDLFTRAWTFVRFAGSVILSLSILLWFLSYFPRADVSRAPEVARQAVIAEGGNPNDPQALATATSAAQGELQLEGSVMGHLGHAIEPVVRPLGFDWRIGVGLVGAWAAREVMVSTMGVLFAVGKDATEADQTLISRMRAAKRPDGTKLFTPAVVASLLVFFAFAMQCMSTFGVVIRETGGWKWPMFLVTYMGILAYSLSFLTYQGLRLAGLG